MGEMVPYVPRNPPRETAAVDDPKRAMEQLIKTVNEQAVGIKILIDLVTDLDKRVRHLELQERKRGRNSAKLVGTNGERII
jgi:hypothetical protein